MGKEHRARFRAELLKLGKIPGPGETPEYYAQNDRVAAAEKGLGIAENLWVRGQVARHEIKRGCP